MTPTYCPGHRRWTDGPCEAAKPPLGREHLTRRIADIDDMLGDGEGSQSRGYQANKALEAERAQLVVLLEVFR